MVKHFLSVRNLTIIPVLWVFATACNSEHDPIPEVELSGTGPVAWDLRIDDKDLFKKYLPGESEVEHLARVRLSFVNLPPSEEGNQYTLIGGGLDNKGLHGPISTGFQGDGYYFAEPTHFGGEYSVRDIDYKDDYTRTVRDGELAFDIFYEPTNLSQLDERFFPGTELALTVMRSGTIDRVLYADDNELYWAIAGVGRGNAAEFEISMVTAEYTWYRGL